MVGRGLWAAEYGTFNESSKSEMSCNGPKYLRLVVGRGLWAAEYGTFNESSKSEMSCNGPKYLRLNDAIGVLL